GELEHFEVPGDRRLRGAEPPAELPGGAGALSRESVDHRAASTVGERAKGAIQVFHSHLTIHWWLPPRNGPAGPCDGTAPAPSRQDREEDRERRESSELTSAQARAFSDRFGKKHAAEQAQGFWSARGQRAFGKPR